MVVFILPQLTGRQKYGKISRIHIDDLLERILSSQTIVSPVTFEQLKILQPKLQDCNNHYMPYACGRSNVLFLAQLIESQAKSLDKKSYDLSFGFFMSGSRNLANLDYYFYQDFYSPVHGYLYEKLNELSNILNAREGVLHLLTGDVTFKEDDLLTLLPPNLFVEFKPLMLEGDELRKHQSYTERNMLMEHVTPSSHPSIKRVM